MFYLSIFKFLKIGPLVRAALGSFDDDRWLTAKELMAVVVQ